MARIIRKKLIAIVEAPHLKRLVDMFKRCGVTGFTVIDGREGAGLAGEWSREDLMDATEKKIVLAVMKAETADAVFDAAAPFFQRYPGIIYAHDVEVVRGERF